jgi:hypothetical protein
MVSFYLIKAVSPFGEPVPPWREGLRGRKNNNSAAIKSIFAA